MVLIPFSAFGFSIKVEKGICFDKSVLKQLNREAEAVCSFSNCVSTTSNLLKSLGYAVEVKGDVVFIEDYRIVESVKFSGIEGLKDVEKVVKFLLLGKPISDSELKSVKQLILLKLKALGFSRAKVSVSLKKGKCGYVAVVSVERGAPLIVQKVSVDAPPGFRERAEKLFHSLVGKPLNYQEVLDLKEKLEELLVEKGYYNCNVQFKVLPVGSGVEVHLSVKPGKLYRVIFKGNRHFSSEKLKKLLTFSSARSVDQFEIENSKNRIVEFYRNKGFPFVRVNVLTVEKEKLVLIEFTIKEGNFVVVKRVKLKGFENKKDLVSTLLGKPFSENKIKSVISRVVSKLKSQGYRTPKVSYIVELSGILTISVDRGPLFRVVNVKVLNDVLSCYKRVKVPFVYTESRVQEIANRISDCYASRGFPDVKVKTTLFPVNKTPLEVDLELKISVNSGKKYRFGYVVVKGLRRTKVQAIRNLIFISPGEIYSRKKVVKQYSKLLDSRLFSSININEVRSDSTVSEIIDLNEGSFLRAKGFIGYGTDYGGVSNGFLSMTSPLGLGLKFFLFGRFRQKEGYDAVFKVLKPAFPFVNWNLGYSIVKKEQIYESFKSDKVLYSFSLERKKTRSFSQVFKVEVSREKVRDTSISAERYSLERRFVYLQTYDRRDNISNPKRGFLSFTRFSFSGLLLGGDADYTLFEEKFLYLKTFKGFTSALRFGFGFINSLRGSSVPLQDRFFLGGAESIRGYKYGTVSPTDKRGNYVGGKAYGLFSFELRHPIKGALEGALFYDAGRVFREPSNFSLSNWYSSVGLGLRYLTPVGPLRIDYGYKLKPVPGQGRGRFHISFGFPF